MWLIGKHRTVCASVCVCAREAVFTLVTRSRVFDVGVKNLFDIEPNGGIFDVSPKNDRASPNVKTP